MSVFKRRKHDPSDPSLPPADTVEGRVPPDFGGTAGESLSQPADDGLGVPPFRPAAPIPALATGAVRPSITPIKEKLAMGRSPFAAPPPAPAPSLAGGSPAPLAQRAAPASAVPARALAEPADRRTLVVGRGISVQGVVQDAERLVVEGTVEATMIHAAELSISHGGVFKGEVEVEEAEVAGTIDGTLTARGNLIVRATGRVLGTARCRRLQVEDGGQITGRIEMLTEGAAPRPALVAPEHGPREAAE